MVSVDWSRMQMAYAEKLDELHYYGLAEARSGFLDLCSRMKIIGKLIREGFDSFGVR